jgi:electron transfer flavoprotein beta subunit
MSNLRILVPIKRVLDYAIKPRIAASGKAIDLTGQKMSLNPFDELSIEASVRLREAHGARISDILAFSAGPTKSQDALRTAMAMGADRGLLVDTNNELEPLAVAKILKKVVEKENINLVILGKQSIDDDAGQTGQMLAGLLGWGQATQAAEIELKDDVVKVVKEVDGGTETVQGKLPMVVTTDLRLNEPRYASLPNIMKAKKKKLEKETLESYGEGLERRLEILEVAGECYGSWKMRAADNVGHRTPATTGRWKGRGCLGFDWKVEGVGRYLSVKCITVQILRLNRLGILNWESDMDFFAMDTAAGLHSCIDFLQTR